MTSTLAGRTVLDKEQAYLSGKTVKAMLVGSGYTFDKDAHDFRDDVTSEVSGPGYTAGGITLTGVAAQLDAANHRVEVVADNANFGTVTLSGVTQIVTYFSTGSAATDRIISVHTFSSQSPAGIPFVYAWNDDDANTGTAGVIGYTSY